MTIHRLLIDLVVDLTIFKGTVHQLEEVITLTILHIAKYLQEKTWPLVLLKVLGLHLDHERESVIINV